jgi:hypothetical protein
MKWGNIIFHWKNLPPLVLGVVLVKGVRLRQSTPRGGVWEEHRGGTKKGPSLTTVCFML